MKVKDRLSDKVRYGLIRSLLPTVEDWNCVRLPDPLYFLYFLIRPLRLMGMGAFLQRLPAVLPPSKSAH